MLIIKHSGAVALSGNTFGQGTGAIVFDYTNCQGNEMTLASCSVYLGYFGYNTRHAEVRCSPG